MEKIEESMSYTREKPLNRGIRQGNLADTLPADPTMPSADFHKPNPLDSDIIMDATARLLAPRKPVVPPAPVKQEQPRKKAEPVQKQEPVKAPEQPKKKKSKKKKKPAATQPAPKAEEKKAQPVKQPAKKAVEPAKPAAAPSDNKKKHRKSNRPRPAEAPLHSDRQKDSTQ